MAHTKKSSQSGSGAPTTVTPEFVGQVYYDTTNGNSYVANGTGSGDWDQLDNDGSHTHTLNDLSDVNISSPDNNDILIYNDSAGEWQAGSLPSPTTCTAAVFIEEREDGGYGGGGFTDQNIWFPRTLNKQIFNNISGCELVSHAITGVSTTNNTFTVSGDVQSDFDVARYMTVRDSTGNDKGIRGTDSDCNPYIIKSVSLDGYNDTVIEVEESVTDSTADGTIYTGRIKIPTGVYLVSATSAAWLIRRNCIKLAKATTCTYSSTPSTNLSQVTAVSTSTEPGLLIVSRSGRVENQCPAPLSTILQVSGTEYWEIVHFVEWPSSSYYSLGYSADYDTGQYNSVYASLRLVRIGDYS